MQFQDADLTAISNHQVLTAVFIRKMLIIKERNPLQKMRFQDADTTAISKHQVLTAVFIRKMWIIRERRLLAKICEAGISGCSF